MPPSPTYHLFISYAQADRAWVEGYLLDALRAAGVSIHSEEAFRLGAPRLIEFENAIKNSKRTLLVLSPAYLAENFGGFVDVLAQSYGAETGTWPVIPLKLHPVALPPRLAQLVALGATDEEEQEAAVARLLRDLNREPPAPPKLPACPYPGMTPFTEAERDRFYGRDREIEELLKQLRLHPFITVIGPSGSGKSSLLFAGLIPALNETNLFGGSAWTVRSLRPGQTPHSTLQAVIGDLVDFRDLQLLNSGLNLLLVVDQFEEIFTLALAEAGVFQNTLKQLVGNPNIFLALTVRADFYPDLMASPLWPQIQAHRLEVLPLDEQGLRHVISKPAEAVGVYVEAALVERLVADAAGEPGVLPLLQETLFLLWGKIERRFLPLRAYEALVLTRASYGAPPRSGLQVAIADRADAALAALLPDRQTIARRIFLRLIQFGEGRADTRRQLLTSALKVADEDEPAFSATLDHLTERRLLTLSAREGETERRVDIAHEALIDGWDRLRGWIKQRRQAEQTRRRLERGAETWVRLEGKGGLLDEIELMEAERWLASADAAELGVSVELQNLVGRSREAIDRAKREEEERQQRQIQLERDKAAAERERAVAERRRAEEQERATRRFQRLAAVLGVVFVIAAVLAAVAFVLRGTSERLRMISITQVLAGEAKSQLELKNDEIAAILARRAYQNGESVRRDTLDLTDAALRAALDAPYFSYVLDGPNSLGRSVALSGDGGVVASGWQLGQVRLWQRGEAGAEPITWDAHSDEVQAVVLSADGRTLISGGCDTREGTACMRGDIKIWDVERILAGAEPQPQEILVGHTGQVTWLVLDTPGERLISGSTDKTVRIWSLRDPAAEPIIIFVEGKDAEITTLALSPDGSILATGHQDSWVRLWDMANPQVEMRHFDENFGVPNALSFSPDGKWLAVGALQAVHVWNVGTWEDQAVFSGIEGRVRSVAFSPDGALLAAVTFQEVYLWDAASLAGTPVRLALMPGHDNVEIFEITFSGDSAWMATVAGDETVRLWDLGAAANSVRVSRPVYGDVVSLAFNSKGVLAAGTVYTSLPAAWWEIEGFPEIVRRFEIGQRVQGVAWSDDDRWFAVSKNFGKMMIWDTQQPQAEPIVIVRGEKRVNDITFSHDGRWLATAHEEENVVRLWEMDDIIAHGNDASPIRLEGHTSEALSVRFSPDDAWLVSGGRDTNIYVWSMARRASQPLYVLTAHEGRVRSVAFSPDGAHLVSGGGDERLLLWNTGDYGVSPLELAHPGWVATVAWSPDGSQIASAGGDNLIRLWDVTDLESIPQNPIILRGYGRFIWSVTFSPDGEYLASGDDSGRVRLWTLDTAALAERVCERVGRNLSLGEWKRLVGRALGDENTPYESICPDLPGPPSVLTPPSD